MIGAAQLALMKPTAYFINVGRGELVDQAALVEALRERPDRRRRASTSSRSSRCPLDDPLLALDNVILTPHWSASTTDVWRATGRAMAEGMLRAAAGQVPENVVNPEVLDRPGFRPSWLGSPRTRGLIFLPDCLWLVCFGILAPGNRPTVHNFNGNTAGEWHAYVDVSMPSQINPSASSSTHPRVAKPRGSRPLHAYVGISMPSGALPDWLRSLNPIPASLAPNVYEPRVYAVAAWLRSPHFSHPTTPTGAVLRSVTMNPAPHHIAGNRKEARREYASRPGELASFVASRAEIY